MSAQDLNRETIFSHAILLVPGEDRNRYLKDACGTDSELAGEIKRLIRFHEKNEAEQFFLDETPSSNLKPHDVAPIAERAGDSIGRYKLLEQIGEGGMGMVYMAEQTEGVRRRVALKIIKLGMDTLQVVARFEAERQAMALFEHPNIARVFDAGSTSTGRPYFVMELVRGTDIIDYAASNRLSLQEKLGLFVDVCHAIQHAHQKGIIHRDLKPSNILVTMFDGVPVPKVIDFGIAKAIGQQRLTERTLFTRYSAMVGTPQYMSPEQAELNGLDVDTRSDIYSLGVLLYQLVTGTTPLSKAKLREINPLALHETLRDAEIETPSSRVSRIATVDDSAGETQQHALAATKESGPNQQTASNQRFNSDLDWVVMKALSRDRAQRYASANEFASDIHRYLAGEPVLAAPPSRVNQLRSYFRRYRKTILTASAMALFLIGASVACFAFALNAYNAQRELSKTNELLTKNVEELELTKLQIREKTDEQLYDSCISISLAKFSWEFQPRVFEIAKEMYPEFLNPTQVPNEASVDFPDDSIEALAEEVPSEDIICEFEICCVFDEEKLLEIPHQELLALPLNRLRKHLDKEKKFFERLTEETDQNDANLLPGVDDHDHSAECLKVQHETNKILVDERHAFFRILAQEYRRTFGDKDPKVAEALNMLADSLIEIGNFNEADAQLRQALLIADDGQAQIARRLLAIVKSEQTVRGLKNKKPKPSQ